MSSNTDYPGCCSRSFWGIGCIQSVHFLAYSGGATSPGGPGVPFMIKENHRKS